MKKIKEITPKTDIRTITQIALFAALQCIVSPFAIVFPFSPVPISLATWMLYLSVYILGRKKAVISCGIYLLTGLVGLPVFSGFSGGIGKVLGPTGGYLIGYLPLVYISGWFVTPGSIFCRGRKDIHKRQGQNVSPGLGYLITGIGMALGTAVCYLIGSAWLAYQGNMSLGMAFAAGALPFIPGDIGKIVMGIVVGFAVKKRLLKAGMI